MLNFLRQHWFDLGAGLALASLLYLYDHPDLSDLSFLLWLNLIGLFAHQYEEYRFPGTFPRMLNRVMYRSAQPDRFPLNPQTALLINVGLGWTLYASAAFLADRALWLGIAAVLVSAGNWLAHTLLFNWRGRTFYNAGMLTAWVFFLPIAGFFCWYIIHFDRGSPMDYVAGTGLGLLVSGLTVKLIGWLADPQTPYAFRGR
ncbi:HXXEE domain-containing protein [Spirosoma taeanense]|uniref:HXXEE domain-containing protein n=1 Tax=Spirosoma taeanense TaxID=2735870 RepID=A0A6M5Y9P6_9BACT|nr:HXXEE domain-containing protein [Spirosoma taeanense]QJW89933.1 HXXEE domain-containing protein [Spirosoma taeanense]